MGHTANNCFRRQNRNNSRRQSNQNKRGNYRNFKRYPNYTNYGSDSRYRIPTPTQRRVNFSEPPMYSDLQTGISVKRRFGGSHFKQTSDPIEEVFQTQEDDIIETDYSCLHSEPLDVYSTQALYDEDFQESVYGTENEFNTLFYDIEQNLESEASQEQITHQASISKSVISTFVCTQQNTQSVCLAQVDGKVRKCGLKLYSNLTPKLILICF